MPKRKRPPKPKNPRAEDLPSNPEFDSFADGVKKLMQVPKAELDKAIAENRKQRKSP
jgi:hypothetical protein